MERGFKRKFLEADLEDGLTDQFQTLSVHQISLLYMLSKNKLAVEMEYPCRRRLQRLLQISKLSSRLKLKLALLEEPQQLLHVPSFAAVSRNSVSTSKQDSLPDISTFMFPMAPCPPKPEPVSLTTDEVSHYKGHSQMLTDLSLVNSSQDSTEPLDHSAGMDSPLPAAAFGSTAYFTSPANVISFTSFNTETGELIPQLLKMTDNTSSSELQPYCL